jgi:hypothetical protein
LNQNLFGDWEYDDSLIDHIIHITNYEFYKFIHSLKYSIVANKPSKFRAKKKLLESEFSNYH